MNSSAHCTVDKTRDSMLQSLQIEGLGLFVEGIGLLSSCHWKRYSSNVLGELGDFRDAIANAPWRNNISSGYEFLGLHMAQGITLSNLFCLEGLGFAVVMVMVDW